MRLHFRTSQHLWHSHKEIKKHLKKKKQKKSLYRGKKNPPVSKSKIEAFQKLCVLESLDSFEWNFYKVIKHQKISQIRSLFI